ncbi:hypothetical protein D3876_10515 [Sphingomonas cavernae]|uniref:Uncharacterized protein n=2 Tax=Sphingomonas cavernae TaxID=2320861 RepID=A0A418WKS0_9SPHN|nr:hypothetical protein D3876_10515 [Sphingomonas cavernae]
MQFLALRKSEHVSVAFAQLVETLCSNLLIEAGVGDAPVEGVLRIRDVANRLGLATGPVADLRRAGIFQTRVALGTAFIFEGFVEAEIEAIATDIKRRCDLRSAARRLGISCHGVEQLMALGVLPLLDHQFFKARYGAPQTTTEALEALERRLLEQAHPQLNGKSIALHRAVQAIGGRQKPWGPILQALLNGEIPFAINNLTGAWSRRIIVDKNHVAVLRDLEFDPTAYRDFPYAQVMTRVDAGEVFNLPPGETIHLLRQFDSTAHCKDLPVSCVLEIAKQQIASVEISMRLRTSLARAHRHAAAHNLPRLHDVSWCRPTADRVVFGHLANGADLHGEQVRTCSGVSRREGKMI